MNQPLSPDQESLLARLAVGERSPAEPEVAAALADPAFRAAWQEQEALQSRLDRHGDYEREVMASAEAFAEAADAGQVAAARAALAPRGWRGSRRRFLAAAVAAGLLVGGWLWWRSHGGDTPDPDRDRVLGPGSLRLGEPVWRAGGGLELHWSSRLPDATFVVTIYDPADPGGKPVAASDEIQTSRWTFEKLTREQLPPDARWRVVARGRGRTDSADEPLPR